MSNNIFQTYKKAKKVIRSCENYLQFRNAKKYVALWFKQHSTYHEYSETYSADALQQELYAKLQSLIYLKKYELKNQS